MRRIGPLREDKIGGSTKKERKKKVTKVQKRKEI